MIDSDTREIRVGSTNADVWVRITDKAGADLSAISPQLRTQAPGDAPGAWFTPAPIQHPSTDVIRCRFEITPAAEDVGWWEVDALVDGEIVSAGGFRVVA